MKNSDDYLTRSLGFLLGDVSRLIRLRFDERARRLDLTRAQWRVLAQLRRREGINQRALADILEIENITLTRHIDRLEAKGLVERRGDPNDRRVRTLHFKPGTEAMLGKMRKLSEQTRAEALNGISERDSEQLIDMLIKIKDNLSGLDRLNPASPGANRSKGDDDE